MSDFFETSFLCAAYREQENSAEADGILGSLPHGAPLSPLVVFEFENSLRLQSGLFALDRSKGFSGRVAEKTREDFRSDIESGIWRIAPVDWAQVIAMSGNLSAKHAAGGLNRAMDILHVATALQLGNRRFFTFDRRQSELAKAAGLKTPLRAR